MVVDSGYVFDTSVPPPQSSSASKHPLYWEGGDHTHRDDDTQQPYPSPTWSAPTSPGAGSGCRLRWVGSFALNAFRISGVTSLLESLCKKLCDLSYCLLLLLCSGVLSHSAAAVAAVLPLSHAKACTWRPHLRRAVPLVGATGSPRLRRCEPLLPALTVWL